MGEVSGQMLGFVDRTATWTADISVSQVVRGHRDPRAGIMTDELVEAPEAEGQADVAMLARLLRLEHLHARTSQRVVLEAVEALEGFLAKRTRDCRIRIDLDKHLVLLLELQHLRLLMRAAPVLLDALVHEALEEVQALGGEMVPELGVVLDQGLAPRTPQLGRRVPRRLDLVGVLVAQDFVQVALALGHRFGVAKAALSFRLNFAESLAIYPVIFHDLIAEDFATIDTGEMGVGRDGT